MVPATTVAYLYHTSTRGFQAMYAYMKLDYVDAYMCITRQSCLHYTLVTVSGLRGQLQAILQCFPTNLRALNSTSASVKSVAQQLKSFDRIFVSQHENLLPTGTGVGAEITYSSATQDGQTYCNACIYL